MKKRILACLLAAFLLLPVVSISINASELRIDITNPYAAVNWATFGQYRTQLHVHTTASDGQNTLAEMVEAYYAAGYDALAITDHGVVDRGWVRPNHPPFDNVLPFMWQRDIVGITPQRYREINQGVGRDGRGMIRIPLGNEQNPQCFPNLTHVVSWFGDWGHGLNNVRNNYSFAVRGVRRAGGISIIAHPSITVGRDIGINEIYRGENNFYVQRIQRELERTSSMLGIEGFDERDRLLWDILLQNLAPAGRNVFLFATDDAHNNTSHIDRRWVVTIMPENTARNAERALRAGAFFSAVRTGDRRAPEPVITEISVQNSTILIEAQHANRINWISNGEVFATGSEINLTEHIGSIGAYVRAEVFGAGVMLYMQPFLLRYEGMPSGNPVPRDFYDPNLSAARRTMLTMYPWSLILDRLWRGFLLIESVWNWIAN